MGFGLCDEYSKLLDFFWNFGIDADGKMIEVRIQVLVLWNVAAGNRGHIGHAQIQHQGWVGTLLLETRNLNVRNLWHWKWQEHTGWYDLSRQNTEWRTILRGPTLWETTVQHPSLPSARGLTSQIFPICFHKYWRNQGAMSFQIMLRGVIASQNAPPLVNF